MEKEEKIPKRLLKEVLHRIEDKKIDYNPLNIIALKEIEAALGKPSDVVLKALSYLKKTDDWCYDGLLEQISIVEKERSIEKKLIRYDFYLPVTHKVRKRSFNFMGLKFKCLSSQQIVSTFQKEKFDHYQIPGRTTPIQSQYHYLKYSTEGINFASSFIDSYPVIEALLGVFNYSITAQSFSIHLPFNYQEAEFSLRNAVFGVDEGGKMQYVELMKLSRGLTSPSTMKSMSDISLKNLNFVLKRLKHLPERNSIEELLFSVFRLYYNAKNSMTNHEAFLNFWRIGESIAIPQGSRADSKTIVKRIGSFTDHFRLHGSQMKNLLFKLSSTRNEIVHRGEDSADAEHLTILKYLIDVSIKWLLDNKEDVKNVQELEYYYQFKDKSESTLTNLLRSAQYIKRKRKVK